MTEMHASVLTHDLTFTDFGVRPAIVDALAAVGITTPFPIQEMTLPVALAGHDIIGQAKTGTGKTLGFGIPLLEHIVGPGEPGWDDLDNPGKPQALVVAPTRELAVQVARDLDHGLEPVDPCASSWSTAAAPTSPRSRLSQPGVEVVVGTPGRMIDLMKQGKLDLRFVRTVVLDEADEMLDLGFLPDVETTSCRDTCRRATRCCSPRPCPAPSSPSPAGT